MSSLGKRKEREEGVSSEHHGSTLFVSNLPYTVTSVDLQTLFSDIAPVRTAFVVSEQGTGVSKGVGYVSFAIKEDAQGALDQIAKEGITLDGRSLRVNWATTSKRKEKGEDVNIKTEQDDKPKAHPKISHANVPRDPLAIRTVIVSGLPSSIDSKTLWKKIRKYEGAERVDWPLNLQDGVEDPSTAHVLFSTPANAQEAVTKLHAHVYKGSLLSVTLKKRLDTVAKVSVSRTPGSTSKKGSAPSRASRLIVRNLPEEKEKEKNEDVKMVEEEALKRQEGKVGGRGFAFVWMLSKKDAEKALEGCNGMKVRAGFALGLVQDKQKKKKERREEKKKLKAAGKKEGGDVEEDAEGQEPMDVDREERVIAVDWALSKEKWEEEKKKMVDEAQGGDEDEESDGGSGSEDGSEGEDDDGDALGLHDGEDGSEDEGSEDEDLADEMSDDGGERTKPQLPPPESGTTLFVRNVPFIATEDELRTLFRAFGPLRYARITMDHETGRSRGTGFACFWNKSDADRAVEQSDILRAETTGQTQAPKKNPFSMPSILTPDPSALSAQSLVLHGRTLDVVRAVTRDEAGVLKEAGEKAREKADKRNMYLLREGVILPNAPAAETLPAGEVERRANSFNARRTLLRSNPSLYVSKTRLSIRQLPPFGTEHMLKRLAAHAVRAFEDDVRAGVREGLSKDELSVVTEVEEEGKVEGKEKGKKGKKGVKQAKIVRQQDRVDAITGKGRSRGYGFLELFTHADALRVLRWANNNPDVGPLFESWWKQEMEEMIKVEEKKGTDDGKTRVKRLRKQLEGSEGGEGEGGEGGKRKARGRLIVEFSIENVQVVQRRAGGMREKKKLADGKKPAERVGDAHALSQPRTKAEPDEDARAKKKRRISSDGGSAPTEVHAKAKKTKKADVHGAGEAGPRVGSLIGRKRRERKEKKGAR